MQEIRFTGELDYTVNNIGFVRVLRNENYRVSYKNGKNRCGLIMVAEGEVEFYFTATKKSVRLGGGAVLFIPKNYPYHATYMQNNTMARVIDFDLNSEDIPLLFREPIYKSGNIFASICHELSGEDAKSITFLVSKIYELLYILEKTNEVVPDRFRNHIHHGPVVFAGPPEIPLEQVGHPAHILLRQGLVQTELFIHIVIGSFILLFFQSSRQHCTHRITRHGLAYTEKKYGNTKNNRNQNDDSLYQIFYHLSSSPFVILLPCRFIRKSKYQPKMSRNASTPTWHFRLLTLLLRTLRT